MIALCGKTVHINTLNTSYIFTVNSHNDLQHLYYGEKLSFASDYSAFVPKRSVLLVNALYPEGDVSYGIDDICYEYSFPHRGDMRDCAAEFEDEDGRVFSFKFDSFEQDATPNYGGNVSSYGYSSSLKVVMKDELRQVFLHLWYFVYDKADVITRYVEVVNNSDKSVAIEKIMSAQLDFPAAGYKFITFDGAWGRERYKTERGLTCGKFVNESLSGLSSAKHNPFVMLAEANTDNQHGNCYGFNLIYSGNHAETAEVTQYDNTRVNVGISASGFRWNVSAGGTFATPEAVLSYSRDGYNGISHNMHEFIRENIIRGYWKNKEKPVLINSWEAMYFDIREDKILRLLEVAQAVHIELFVIDDGWFGKRDDDKSSLGDWFVNEKKFPRGLSEISAAAHQKNMLFGLWFEPEMVNENSLFFAAHPDWVFKIDGIEAIVGRNQRILDLTRADARDYIVDKMRRMIEDNGIDYIKWDCNRQFSDISSKYYQSGELLHRYVLGLYEILAKITALCPKVLFELCSAGGNRFDLGMLAYCPVGWVSDNTDVLSRAYIQEGTSYGYPVSTMCNHISPVPNHQTRRNSKLQDRCNLASFGVLGCQMDLAKLDEAELADLTALIDAYKTDRKLINNGVFYRIVDGFQGNYNIWQVMDKDKKRGKLIVLMKQFQPGSPTIKIALCGLDDTLVYEISDESGKKAEALGEVFAKNGFILPQNYQGNEIVKETRVMLDFSTVVYDIAVKA